MNEAVFGQILQFIYSHNCDLLVEGTNVAHFRLQDVIRATMEAARRVDLENMCKALRKFHVVNDIVHLKPNERRSELPPRRFVRNFHEDLSDITLCSQDGHKFKAHRCILVSRSEYFYSMLYANVWLEVSFNQKCSFTEFIMMSKNECIYSTHLSSQYKCSFPGPV